MGFIKDNTNTFEICLTDLGKQKFFDGGFKDSITYFSLSDGGSNYEIFIPDPNLVKDFDDSIVYPAESIVKYSGKYYRAKEESPADIFINVEGLWEETILYDPTKITTQAIPTIDHVGTKKTSLGNGVDGEFINDVFTQTQIRGSVSDNIEYRRALLGTRDDTQKDYIFYEPDINIENIGVLTYKIIK